MFKGTNLILGEGRDPKEYSQIYFEYPANQKPVLKGKTQRKSKDSSERIDVVVDGKKWEGLEPADLPGKNEPKDKLLAALNLAPEATEQHLAELAQEALNFLQAEYDGTNPYFTMLRLCSKGYDLEQRVNLTERPVDYAAVRVKTINDMLRAKAINPLTRKAYTREELEAMFPAVSEEENQEAAA